MKKGEIVLEIKYLPPLGHVGVVVPDLEKALDAFVKVGKKYEILGKTKQEIIDRYGM